MSPLRPVHPTARAFFDALLLQGEENNATSTAANTAVTNLKSCSDVIRKTSRTLGWRNRYSQADRYPVTILQTNDGFSRKFSIKQIQRGEVDGTYGTGATVWPASMVLLKYLEQQQQQLENKTVIDLGAGTGILSIGAALLGASRVVCTDGSENVVQLAKENVIQASKEIGLRKKEYDGSTGSCEAAASCVSTTPPANSKEKDVLTTKIGNCNMQVKEYSWGDGSIQDTFDVILVSDCVLPKLYPIAPLVQALDELLHRGEESSSSTSSVAILSYEHRYYPDYDPRVEFRNLCQQKGLQVSLVPIEKQHSVYSVDDIEVWEVRRKTTTTR